MHSGTAARSSLGVRLFVEVGSERGVSAGRLLAGTGLSAASLAVPDAQVLAGQEIAVARNLLNAVDDAAGLGIDAGRRVSVGHLGVWAFAALTSATVGEAIGVLMRFSALSPVLVRVEAVDTPTALEIVLHDDHLPEDVRVLIIERELAAVATFIKLICGTMPRLRLQTLLSADRRQLLAPLFAPAQVQPSSHRTALVWDRRLLATRLPEAEPTTRAACERVCLDLLASRSETERSHVVRTRLLHDPQRMPTLEQTAHELGVEARTLQRQLRDEQTSFVAIRDEIRRELALELLTNTTLTIGEIAHRLGFSEPATFSRAVKRWTGAPPSAIHR